MNKEDLDGWKNHPVTQEVFKYLEDYSKELAQNLATENFGDSPSDAVARAQAQTFGMCSALNEIATIDFDQVADFYHIETEEEDEELQQTGGTPD